MMASTLIPLCVYLKRCFGVTVHSPLPKKRSLKSLTQEVKLYGVQDDYSAIPKQNLTDKN
ncbi:MAG: hypothetical protein AAF383_09610 [Cyanobacteria bacterium P01_A01_bin.83]